MRPPVLPLLLLCATACGGTKADADPGSYFDRAPSGPGAGEVGAVARPEPVYAGQLVVVTHEGAPTWALQPIAPCDAAACLGEPVPLGDGYAARLVGMLDFAGDEAVTLPAQSLLEATLAPTLPKDAALPAAVVVRATKGLEGDLHDVLTLVSTRGDGVLWTTLVTTGLLSTSGDIRFVPVGGERMAVELTHTSLAGGRPGPPQTFRHTWNGTTWEIAPPP